MIKMQLNSTDLASLNLNLNRLAEQTGKTLTEVLPSQMRLLASDLSFVTYPKGKGSSDNKQHMERIRARIRQVYPTVGFIMNLLKGAHGPTKRFAELITARQYTKAQKITEEYLPNMRMTIGAFDGGALHRSQADKKRVTHHLLVPAYTRVEAYANATARKSGFAKGGFATAARQLGGVRGIPGFATRQKSPGTGKIVGDGKTLQVIMTNDITYLRDAMKPSDEATAVANRSKQVGLLLKRIQDRKIKETFSRL